MKKKNSVLNADNNIVNDIAKMDIAGLNKGIWHIIDKYTDIYSDVNLTGYKEYYTIMQNIENLKNEYFCIRYTKIEGCTNPTCSKFNTTKESFTPYINFDDEYIDQYSIEYLLDYLFSTTNSYCAKSQWKNDMIIKKDLSKYSKTFTNIITPKFLFISFETNLANVFISNVDSPKLSKNEMDRILFERNIKYISKLDYILADDFIFCDCKYCIRGLVKQKYSGHYSAILINLKENSFFTEKGKTYYYDDTKNNNEIILLNDWRSKTKENTVKYWAIRTTGLSGFSSSD